MISMRLRQILPAALLLIAVSAIESSAAEKRPLTDATVVATWDGGKVTVGQVKAKAKELTSRRSIYTFASAEDMYEASVRQSALAGILLKKASDLGLEKAPGWPAAEKIIENRALYELIVDELWQSVKPTKLEIEKFSNENPQMLLVPGNAKTGGTEQLVYAPSESELVTWHIRSERTSPLLDALSKDAQSKYKWDCPSPEEWMKAKDDAVMVRIGTLAFTRKEARELSALTASPVEWCSQFYLLGDGNDSVLPQGELARAKGYAKSPKYADTVEAQRKAWLIWAARNRLLDELLSSYSPSEAEIKDYYDKNYDVQEPQTIMFDALLAPIGSGESEDRDGARGSASAALARLKEGASFESVLKERPELRYLPVQGRTINPGAMSEFSDKVAGLKPGDLAAELIEDYGGYCIIRVTENRPRMKMPLPYMRGAVLGDMKFEYHRGIRRDVDGTILQKYKFSLKEDVLADLIRNDS